MNKINLLILLWGKLLKNKRKQLKIKEKKQIDALKSLEFLKPKEVKSEEKKPIDCDDYFINRMTKIRYQSKKIDLNNLTYIFKGKTAPKNFIGFKGPQSIYSGDIALEDVEKDKKKLKAELGCIKQGDPKDKSKEQSKVINNVISLYESREKVVQMFNNYPKENSRRIYESRQGK